MIEQSDGTGDSPSDARLAAIVESSFDAIVSKDLNGIITSWNPAAEKLFGYTAQEAVGQSILIIIPDDRRREEDRIIRRIRRGERVETFETVRSRKDGSPIHVSLTISPIRAGGRIIGASKIARDTSAAKESERRIKMLMREVNHRVKNQYAVILSLVRETVQRSVSLSEFEKKIRERIMSLAKSHDLLVNVGWQGVPLEDLVRQQLESFGGEEEITVSGPPLIIKPAAVQNLGMAIHELATNSAKYGVLEHGGTITVSWKIKEADSGNAFRLTWFEDTAEPPLIDHKRKPLGFGSLVLGRVVAQALNGSAQYERSDGRVIWTLTAPLAEIADTGLELE